MPNAQAQRFTRALEIIRTRGWVQKLSRDWFGQVCAGEALSIAGTERTLDRDQYFYGMDADCDLFVAVANELFPISRRGGWDNVPLFNDCKRTKKEMVEQVLEKCAIRAEEMVDG